MFVFRFLSSLLSELGKEQKKVKCAADSSNILVISGIPRHLDPQDGYLRREAKQKREGSPPHGPGSLSDPMKGRESMVPTVKEPGRSIHLIPREELRQPSKEGIITQVHTG